MYIIILIFKLVTMVAAAAVAAATRYRINYLSPPSLCSLPNHHDSHGNHPEEKHQIAAWRRQNSGKVAMIMVAPNAVKRAAEYLFIVFICLR